MEDGNQQASAARARPPNERLPDYLTVAAAFVVWRVFFPGLMSPDSISQYGQAVSGQYNDWHPPLMSIVLKIVLASGGALGILMLGQCLAGMFGLRALAAAGLRFFFSDRLSRRSGWISFFVLLVLLIPLTPLYFHLMTFWKDTWALILLLWICALAINFSLSPPTPKGALLLAGLGAALGLVRHNAVLTLPLIGWILWTATRRSRKTAAGALALAAAPLAIYLAANPLMDLVFGVEEVHVDSLIMAQDLVGLCAKSPSACHALPWTESHLLDASILPAVYHPAEIAFLDGWVAPSIRADYPRLREEYLRAFRTFPLLFARVKLEAFEALLGFHRTYYFFHDSIFDNPYGLALNPRFTPLRRLLSGIAWRVAEHPLLRWISGVHGVWILANIVWIAGLLAASFKSRTVRYRALAWVLLIPLSYYLSYLLAAPVADFRFMYPATLAVQCLTLAVALGRLAQRF